MELPVIEIAQAESCAHQQHHSMVRRVGRFRIWTWAHRFTAAGFLLILVVSRHDGSRWFRGSITAAEWFGWLAFLDPLAAVEVAVASLSVSGTMIVGFATILLLTLLLGRVFCGWLCPLGLLLELNHAVAGWLRGTLNRFGLQPPSFHAPRALKYWVLAFCLSLSVIAAVPLFTALSPINLTVLGLAVYPAIAVAVLVPLALLEFFVPRAFCRSLCPLGALYSMLGRFAPFRVRIVGTERLHCQQCTRSCPMGIRVMEDHVLIGRSSVDDPECTRCGTCTDACLGEILRIGLSRRQPSAVANDAKPSSIRKGC